MALLEGSCREVLDLTEVVALVTTGEDGPHITATWGDYMRTLGIGDDRLVIPAGFYRQMEANLARNDAIQVLVASRQVQGNIGMGQGFTLKGTGRIVLTGEDADRVKAAFSWARGALIVDVTEATAHL
jgi:predicted pyridoxine 5'-phosphate oxidase superfamily flavin-nucleotide-binding protein